VLAKQRREHAILDELASGKRVANVDPKLAFAFLWLLMRKREAVDQRIWHTPTSPWEVEPHSHTRLVFDGMQLAQRQQFVYDGLSEGLVPPYIVGPDLLVLQHLSDFVGSRHLRLGEAKRMPPGEPFVLADQGMFARTVRLFERK
jgi:hypothetical protein